MRAAVAAGDARRRSREANHRLWRVAPAVAAGCLLVAGVSWWMGASSVTPLLVTALSAAGVAAYTIAQRRVRAVSDAVAARIDADAGLAGELRSASWFAAREERDEWVAFHLSRAADRLSDFNWSQLYPPVRALRAQVVTGAMLAGAIAIAWSLSDHSASGVSASPIRVAGQTMTGEMPGQLEMVPEDLRRQIEELLAAAAQGTLAGEKQTKRALELWNMFEQINADMDPEALKALAKAMDPTKKGSADMASKALMDLANKAQKAAEAKGLSGDMKKALEDLGMEMAQSADAEQRMAASDSQNAQKSSTGSGKDGEPGAASAEAGSLDQANIQFSKDTAGAGASMMMMSSQMGPKGDPAAGFGGAGNSGEAPNNGTMPGLQQALRRETVEASEDVLGENVLSETRKKTEHGQATVTYTRGASGASDRSKASAPPTVPEGRRAAVQTYFTRKK